MARVVVVDARRGRSSSLWIAIALAIAAVGVIAVWDEERESAAALREFGDEQRAAAQAMAAALAGRLAAIGATARAMASAGLPAGDASGLRVVAHPPGAPRTSGDPRVFAWTVAEPGGQLVDVELPIAALAGAMRDAEQRGSIAVLLRPPGSAGLVTTRGAPVGSAALDDAAARGAGSLRLSREQAAELGLPARTAMAGAALARDDALGTWGVVVAASALRERDREIRAQWRLGLGFFLVSGLVLAFGGVALREQRKELALARELAVTEAMRARDERLVRADKLAMLGALGTGIAHEVSTPLGVIVGRAEQLLPKLTDERARRSAEAILEQATRIGRVVRAFLGLARGGAPMLERVAPADVARAARELVEHRFAKAGVHLATRADAPLPRIACDPRLFEQVLVNLLLNACDACARGGHVELAVTGDAARVAFVVTDDGAGIAPEDARRAVEPFFTTKAPGEGTGLGLAIANEIVKHHHGELTIAPRERGRGTRATVEIAAARDDGAV